MKSSKELYRVVVVAVALVSSVVGQRKKNLHIKNHSGKKAEIYWLDGGGEMVLQAPFMDNGQALFLSKCLSYVFDV